MSSESPVSSFFSVSSSSPPPQLSGTDVSEQEDQARENLNCYEPKSPADKTVAIIQAFLDMLPTDGKHRLLPFVASCRDKQLLSAFAEHLSSAVLFALKSNSKTPVTPSPPLDADGVEEVASEIEKSASRDKQSKLKKDCLERDGYRCQVTSCYDTQSLGKIPGGISEDDDDGETELAHIIPFALGKYQNKNEEVRLAHIWNALYTCFPSLRSLISPAKINEYSNLMTLLAPVHSSFGKFKLAFERTDNENVYRIHCYPGFQKYLFHILPSPDKTGQRTIKFEKHADYDLPDPVLLDTHAAVAKILHASGMAETVEKACQDMEEIRCLASNGTTDLRALSLLLSASAS